MKSENKYCVYLHRDMAGVVFYVGKGTLRRATSEYNRSTAWNKMAMGGYTCQVLKQNMSSHEALVLEGELIKHYWGSLVNTVTTSVVKELDYAELSSIFYYDTYSPSGLRWKTDRLKNCGAKMIAAGDQAGNMQYDKNRNPRCWRVFLKKKSLLVHRVIWVLLNGDLPKELVIDHLDGNPFNNHVSNLKLKTYADNSRNRKHTRSNTGVVGVAEMNNKDGTVCFRATWSNGAGKSINKSFSVYKYGREEAFRLACEVRQREIEKLRLLGFDYTDRHVLAQ